MCPRVEPERGERGRQEAVTPTGGHATCSGVGEMQEQCEDSSIFTLH